MPKGWNKISSEFAVHYSVWQQIEVHIVWWLLQRLDELFRECGASICLTIHEIDWNTVGLKYTFRFIMFHHIQWMLRVISSSFVQCRARHHFLIVAPPGVAAVPMVLAWVDAMAPNCKWPVSAVIEEKLLNWEFHTLVCMYIYMSFIQ